jgi:general L-amino acid transport system permease protein
MSIVKYKKTAPRDAPLSETTFIGWLQKNLFSSWVNTILTIISLYIVYAVVKSLWFWGIQDAVWVAENRRECSAIANQGACWAGFLPWLDDIY